MPRKSKKPIVLLIEGLGPNDNLILALDNLEVYNKSLRNDINTNTDKLHQIRKMIDDI
jgi:hypothetical protein